MKIRNFLGIALLLLVAAGSQPAIGAYWQWSRNASSNATADPSINWAEGQSPSSINDSARAQMARSAEERDDISGLLATTGTSTAYLVTTFQGLNTPTPTNGQLISITVNSTNGAGATLAADGGNAYPFQISPGVAAPAGTMISGSPYSVKFSVADSAWMLKGFYGNSLTVPLGAMVPYTLATVPNSNFVFPAGQCLSTTTYATYWAALGSPSSGSCGGGQFRILDMSGRVAAGLDTMPGFSAVGRLTASSAGCGTAMTSVGAVCANGSENHTLTVTEMPAHNHSISDPGHFHSTLIPQPLASFAGGGFSANAGAYTTNQNSDVKVTNITINNNGGSSPHPIVQPTIGVTYLLRVL